MVNRLLEATRSRLTSRVDVDLIDGDSIVRMVTRNTEKVENKDPKSMRLCWWPVFALSIAYSSMPILAFHTWRVIKR